MTAGELGYASSGLLYKPTGSRWSSVIVQIFPADLFASIGIHSIPLHNEDIRRGDPSKSHETRIDAIARSLSQVTLPFSIDVRDTVALIWPMPVAGLSTFGELFGINVDETLTALVFFDARRKPLSDPVANMFPVHYANFVEYFTRSTSTG